jgi:ABC-type transport system substrate-binding protein
MSMSDPEQLSAAYMEMTEILCEATLWYSLVDMTTAYAYNSDISGYEPLLFGNVIYSNLAWTA